VERHGMELAVFGNNGKNCGEGIVRGISFNDNRSVRDPMSKDRSRGKGFLQQVEGFPSLIGKLEWDAFAGETGERDNNIGVVENEASVEVGEAKEGLNVPHFPWLGPILYGLDLSLVHGESLGGENVSEVFNSFRVEFTLVRAGE